MVGFIIQDVEIRGGWIIRHAAKMGVEQLSGRNLELRTRVLAALPAVMVRSRDLGSANHQEPMHRP